MSDRLLSLAIIVGSVIADRVTKAIAVARLKETSVIKQPLIDGVFSFTYHENKGAAFGMLADSRWIFMTVSTVAIIAIAVYLFAFSKRDMLCASSLSLIVGGGIGNMIDRTAYGYVVDFLNFELIDFPIFNFADICVTVGAFLMVVKLLFFDKEKETCRG